MNIAFAVHYYDRSEGTGGYVAELLPRIAREHDVTLYCAAARSPVPDGVEVIHVPALRGRTYATIMTFPLAFRMVRRKHDVLHAQGWVTGSADVATAHIVMAGWRRAARAAAIKTPAGEKYLGGLVEHQEGALFRHKVGRLIAPSHKAKAEIAKYYRRSESVFVVHHGFPEIRTGPGKEASRSQLGLPDKTVALFVGDTRKGLSEALEAVAKTPNTCLAVVSRSNTKAHTALAASFGVADRVRWIGEMKDPSLAYAAADVLLHPTIYDTFGLVVAEAMASGIPAITTKQAGISELIDHRVSGWIVEGDFAIGTTTALHELSANSDLRKALGAEAQRVAASRDWDKVATETVAVYRQAKEK